MLIEKVCGITLVHVMRRPYPIELIFDGDKFLNADVWYEDYHEIIISEESLEAVFPGLLAEARARIA